MTDHDGGDDDVTSDLQATAIESAVQLLRSAALDHELDAHDGEGCPVERLRMFAFVGHVLGFPAAIMDSKGFLKDLRAELARYEAAVAAETAAELIGYDGPLH